MIGDARKRGPRAEADVHASPPQLRPARFYRVFAHQVARSLVLRTWERENSLSCKFSLPPDNWPSTTIPIWFVICENGGSFEVSLFHGNIIAVETNAGENAGARTMSRSVYYRLSIQSEHWET